ncbi:UDP-N-acetylglucosamine--N-acetylmuramyl-(pentapeptide) pyrophosphoryl-undecaprenol N-acetylglucosamine transferase [Lichenihabitans sp. Uapishka_5]|uniref:UDP-N-acetylglucosamine--N-acetylmuramyl- (pentapeptide) pyrophosphoryl-undecaprenol N-acetylglucosamine transferase n=1 Tax=Lichenihabitans sp. Uapishka_5 TaxID=3037302 RepID=UPI0029E80F70|nr:UDP-N-acetylglucosamine--N-acetylmuramyl-(pentapeptide) pyrophosphoryl-undecaprenol N-acetylglucosamine transferase [Lichenihabitans sp. Uapishka_5]MDX7952259.1 UDP-N-acetylglucosamine--N-acetylmuramyl-(pentapeptide) pyrophosphoryl-undecaprenol N-acetylglucosamine transferase [Lichenihabitans sp. Uapishka_5]
MSVAPENRPVLLAAGGTGGHLFPAEALARVLLARGVAVELMTDTRALAYAGQFPARAVHAVPSATPSSGSPAAKAKAALQLGRGTLQAYRLLGQIRPRVVVGFGGYPTVPPLLAAAWRKLPVLLHEQNAVMGRANRFLAGRATRIATGFPRLGKAAPAIQAKATHTGNPIRPAVLAAAAIPYPALDGTLRLLVTGGSQGARVMADVVPPALVSLPAALRARLRVVQQARGEDEARVRGAYQGAGIAAEVAPFFPNLPERMAQAHLVIGRSGASTVSELAVIGRPSLLVPLPGALDQDQAANAAILGDLGAAAVVLQPDFTPALLAAEVSRCLADPSHLAERGAAALQAGEPRGAERLADLVLTLAHSPIERPETHP